MLRRTVLFLFLLAWSACARDLDGDLLDDSLEQTLLERFVPRFLIATGDCDVAPATFLPGHEHPRPAARAGILYGQALPLGNHVELHYYHLWARDCGRNGHAFDVEHVSALIDAATGRALYWYAAAHADTLCAAGHGAQSKVLDAEMSGPLVWVSRDKHASFLDEARCPRGCGGDECTLTRRWTVERVINVGEQGKPLNGAVWTGSKQWNFAAKMKSDFPPTAIATLAAVDRITGVQAARGSVRSTIGAGNTTIDAFGTADRHTRSAVGTANRRTRGWLRRTLGL